VQVSSIQFCILEDLKEQSSAEGFASMYGYHGAATIIMSKKVVTSFDSYHRESVPREFLDELFALQFGKLWHTHTATR
jgi:hypothetical protein